MTAQQLIELVLNESPLDDGAIATLYLQQALDEFCEETLILRRKGTITLASEALEHEISDPSDIIRLRQVAKGGVQLVNTDAPSYLADNNGYWYVKANTPLTMRVGQWSSGSEVPFKEGTALDIVYEAYARKLATDGAGNEDFSVEPEIPRIFHMALTYRANEKAFSTSPEMRTYWHALWSDQIKKGKRKANEMLTNAPINPKIYTL